MSEFEQMWTEYQPIIASTAYQWGGKAKRWGGSHEDFSQEFALWMLDNQPKLIEMEGELGKDEFAKYLGKCLHNEAADYYVDIQDAGGGQPRRGAYWYTTGDLKTLLPAMLDREQWLNPPQSDGKTVSDPAHGNNWIATLSDISRAFDKLDETDQMFLRTIHQDGVSNQELADSEGVTKQTMSYRHTQALKRLLRHLGGEKPRYMRADRPHDPWRGRHAVSNAAARALTGSYYDD